jgi:hypothetical protein
LASNPITTTVVLRRSLSIAYLPLFVTTLLACYVPTTAFKDMTPPSAAGGAPHTTQKCSASTHTTTTEERSSSSETVEQKLQQQQPKNQNYFAIGSMMNPTSAKNRGLNLEQNAPAQPGILLDHKLAFFSNSGFAEAIYEKGSTMHGVVYRNVPADQMQELDRIERDYIRVEAHAKLYKPHHHHNDKPDNNNNENMVEDETITFPVTVYCRPEGVPRGPDVDKPPSERYLQIIIAGAKHHGVDPSYIDYLEKVESRPRPCPTTYLSFPTQEGAMNKFMTRDHVETHGTGDNGNPFYMLSQGRVIECSREPDHRLFQEFAKMAKTHGRDVELFINRLIYDPLYGTASDLEDVTPEYGAYAEHNLCEYLQGINQLQNWQVIARIKNPRE